MKQLLSCILVFLGLIAHAQKTLLEGDLPYEGTFQMKGQEKQPFTYRLLAKPHADFNYVLLCYAEGTKDTLYQWCNRLTQKSYMYRSGSDTVYEITYTAHTDITFENPNQKELTNYKEINGVMYMPIHVHGIKNTKLKLMYAAEGRDCRFKDYRLFMAPYVYEFSSKSGKLMMYYDWSGDTYKLNLKPNDRKAKLTTPYTDTPPDLVSRAIPNYTGKTVAAGDALALWFQFMKTLPFSEK